ncbi:hypothetical protein DM02DRAFT_730455 [Periconia macrospinosa]|uniref:Protein kinase domain-containing protein n=1 Tax=Periconia macrospinosa TaxID=97972 RepID=A0A2V1DHG8_9PLEO|nr:hypothetical protein DM02DRAFT_730455 [Periconia macrospinosa]
MNENIPPYAPIDLYLGDCDASLTIMSHGKRFHIFFDPEDIQGPDGDEGLMQIFLSYKERMDDELNAMVELEEWMLEPCVTFMNKLAPALPSSRPLSLAEYFNPETFILRLVRGENGLEAVRCPDDPSIIQFITPKVALSDPIVSDAISKGVPCIKASQLVAIEGPDALGIHYDQVPRTVRTLEKESKYHFKRAFDRESLTRELEILLQLQNISFPEALHVSKLGGLVMWDDELSIMGILVDYVDDSHVLDNAAKDASEHDREKWARQIHGIVNTLHNAGIVWGDVKPDNILVDSKMDAWVIDFGGGHTEGWVDAELMETKEGDLQGLRNLDEFLKV